MASTDIGDIDLSKLAIQTNLEDPDIEEGSHQVFQSKNLGPPKSPQQVVVNEYLRERDALFAALEDLKDIGWTNPDGDVFYDRQKKQADECNESGQKRFYELYQVIAQQMHSATGSFSLKDSCGTDIRLLDLCMAPGGYSRFFLQLHPNAQVRGISLPVEKGGHIMLLPHGLEDQRVEVKFMDITLLACECGVSNSVRLVDYEGIPDYDTTRPFLDQTFDVVFCDGQVLRTHQRSEYRQEKEVERTRLINAQLVLGINRIKVGGTLIMLLHKVDGWRTIELLSMIDAFSTVQLFKPRGIHAQRSSFYLVAKDVQPELDMARSAKAKWMKEWKQTTFPHADQYDDGGQRSDLGIVRDVLERFGTRLIALAQPIWEIQLKALKKAPYIQTASGFDMRQAKAPSTETMQRTGFRQQRTPIASMTREIDMKQQHKTTSANVANDHITRHHSKAPYSPTVNRSDWRQNTTPPPNQTISGFDRRRRQVTPAPPSRALSSADWRQPERSGPTETTRSSNQLQQTPPSKDLVSRVSDAKHQEQLAASAQEREGSRSTQTKPSTNQLLQNPSSNDIAAGVFDAKYQEQLAASTQEIECTRCGFSFRYKKELFEHLRTAHGREDSKSQHGGEIGVYRSSMIIGEHLVRRN